MTKVDARGLSCPEPVVMTMQAAATGAEEIEVLVDQKVCVENVSRFAFGKGFQVTVAEEGGEYILTLKK